MARRITCREYGQQPASCSRCGVLGTTRIRRTSQRHMLLNFTPPCLKTANREKRWTPEQKPWGSPEKDGKGQDWRGCGRSGEEERQRKMCCCSSRTSPQVDRRGDADKILGGIYPHGHRLKIVPPVSTCFRPAHPTNPAGPVRKVGHRIYISLSCCRCAFAAREFTAKMP